MSTPPFNSLNPQFRPAGTVHLPPLEADSIQAAARKLSEAASAFLCSVALQRRLPDETLPLALCLARDATTLSLEVDDGSWPKPLILPLLRFTSLQSPNPECQLFVRVSDITGPYAGGRTAAGTFAWGRLNNPDGPDWKTLGWTRFRLEAKSQSDLLAWFQGDPFRFRLWSHLFTLFGRGEYRNLPRDLSYSGLIAFLEEEASDAVIEKLGGRPALQRTVTMKARRKVSEAGRNSRGTTESLP